ncbi:MAG TPA: hypothetical protein VFR24_08800 [Candidatus Angelobacter sp.]|jgi:hypothetical protein|nr:hypothetical protein [Candidatus Angelobacter sp.]
MKKPSADERFLRIEEIRVIADLRIMHSKINELFQVVSVLKRRHPEMAIREYADQRMLDDDIKRVDEIYLWFIGLKEEGLKLRKR